LQVSVKRQTGFSLTELIVALLVAMILLAMGLPAFLRAYRTYQLNSAARQMADILRSGRYTAINMNTSVNTIVNPNPPMTQIWVDSVPNGTLDPTEKTILLGPPGNLADAGGVPGTAGLFSAAVGSVATVAVSSASPTRILFDARGAVNPPTKVTVFYLNSSVEPDLGYRAVLLMPAGSTQIWISDTSGNWQYQQ
jgi:Tfp pilus assembly protein FimT